MSLLKMRCYWCLCPAGVKGNQWADYYKSENICMFKSEVTGMMKNANIFLATIKTSDDIINLVGEMIVSR